MPDYGKAQYWDKRYTEDGLSEPFDWLFDFSDLKGILDALIPDKDTPILMVGAGNAPFSIDVFSKGGYRKICNIDLSNVVIKNQMTLFPDQQWMVMDVRNMDFADGTFPVVLDKSLIDTLLCYKNSFECTARMIEEIHRVLADDGIYVTFSLHPIADIRKYFVKSEYSWSVHTYTLRSSRWNETDNRKRSPTHSMVICTKAPNTKPLPHIPDTISEDELHDIEAHAKAVNLRAALLLSTVDELRYLLDQAILESDPVATTGTVMQLAVAASESEDGKSCSFTGKPPLDEEPSAHSWNQQPKSRHQRRLKGCQASQTRNNSKSS